MDITVTKSKLLGMSVTADTVVLSVEATEGSQPTVSVDGMQVTGSINGLPAHQVNAPALGGERKPVGPRDQFTGPWQPGDRQPTDMEQITKPQWFVNLPNTRVDDPTQNAQLFSKEVSIDEGPVVDLDWPNQGPGKDAQYKVRVRMNNRTGKIAFRLKVGPGSEGRWQTASPAGAGDSDFIAAFGVFSIPDKYSEGPTLFPNLTWTKDGRPGYHVALVEGDVVYLNYEVHTVEDWDLDLFVKA